MCLCIDFFVKLKLVKVVLAQRQAGCCIGTLHLNQDKNGKDM